MNYKMKYKNSVIGYSIFSENIDCNQIYLSIELGNSVKEVIQSREGDITNLALKNTVANTTVHENIKINDNNIRFKDKIIACNGPFIIMDYFIYKCQVDEVGYYKVLYLDKRNIGYVYCQKSYQNKRIIYLPNATILFGNNGYLEHYKGKCNGLEIIQQED
ncbi:MAG: hypothetical protein ACERKZ_03870 [Lachnotalea sp.]